jgi:hypothetical protein
MVGATPLSSAPNVSQPQQSQGLGSRIIGGKPYEEMSDMERFIYDAQQVQAEQEARRAVDPNYTGGLTDYELSKEANRINQGQQADNAGKNQYGMIGPPEYDASEDYDFTKNMPGSTARIHYNTKGEYIPAMSQDKKEREARKMAEESCPSGMEYDPDSQRCVPEGTLKKARQDKRAASQPKREAGVNAALAIGNMVVGAKERANELLREQQIKDEAWQNQFVTAYKPSDRGKWIPNKDEIVVPTLQTPVQLAGTAYKQGYGYSKKGGSVMYLTEKQINDIISLGGEVEFIK